jgi:protease II
VTEVPRGVTIADPYRWLDQKASATRAWLAAQDKFARDYLDSIPGRDQLRKELGALLKIDRVSSPIARGGRYFFSRRSTSEERQSLCARQGISGQDEVLVDPAKAVRRHRLRRPPAGYAALSQNVGPGGPPNTALPKIPGSELPGDYIREP